MCLALRSTGGVSLVRVLRSGASKSVAVRLFYGLMSTTECMIFILFRFAKQFLVDEFYGHSFIFLG